MQMSPHQTELTATKLNYRCLPAERTSHAILRCPPCSWLSTPWRWPIFTTIIILVLGILAWTIEPVSSYLRTSTRLNQEAIHQAVPHHLAIERLRTLVHDLDKVIAEQHKTLTTRRVETDLLAAEVDGHQERELALHAQVSSAREALSAQKAAISLMADATARSISPTMLANWPINSNGNDNCAAAKTTVSPPCAMPSAKLNSNSMKHDNNEININFALLS